MDIQKITKLGDNFTIEYKRSTADIAGKLVEIPAGTSEKTLVDIQAEIDNWNSRKVDCQLNIDRLTAELNQCKAL